MRVATIIRSVSLLGAGTIGTGLLALVAQIVFARQLGQAGYGAIASALSLVNLVAAAAVFGVNVYWLRAFGRDGYGALSEVTPSLRLVGLASAATGAVYVGLVVAGPFDALTRELLPWFAIVAAAQVLQLLVRARFQLEERFGLLALWQLVPPIGRVAIAAAVGLAGMRFAAVGPAFGAWSTVTALAGLVLLGPLLTGKIRLAGHTAEKRPRTTVPLGSIARRTAPFAVSALAFWTYFQCDVILLNWIRGERAAGVYGVAVALVTAFQVVPQMVFMTFVRPMQHRWADHDRGRLDRSFVTSNRVMLGLGIAAAAVLAAGSPWAVPFVFGERYAASVPLAAVLAICIPLRFLTATAAGVTSTTGLIGSQVRAQVGTALLNVGLNLVAIPWLGALGAALTTVISEAAMTIALQWWARGELRNDDGRRSPG